MVAVDAIDSSYVYPDWKMTETDPRLDQPEAITLPLKPHQLTAAYRMVMMERTNQVSVRFDGVTKTYRGNVGILGDIPGRGKTLTMLAAIAANKDFHTIAEQVYGVEDPRTKLTMSMHCTKPRFDTQHIVSCTIIAVPRGLVFAQWKEAIATQTNLRYVTAERSLDFARKFPSPNADGETIRSWFKDTVVLISSTFLHEFVERYLTVLGNDRFCWARLVIDEAHDIKIPKFPDFQPFFLWLVTASYDKMYGLRSSRGLISRLASHFHDTNKTMLRSMTVVNHADYVEKSFEIPNMIVTQYRVQPAVQHQHVLRRFVDTNVREMLAANDIPGVVAALGGRVTDGDDVIGIITRTLANKVSNLELTLRYQQDHWVGPERESVLSTTTRELARARQEFQAIRQRLEEAETECSICYGEMEHPATLPCAHRFCGQCIYRSLLDRPTCPLCREPVRLRDVLTVVPGSSPTPSANDVDPTDLRHLSKNRAVLHLLNAHPDGQFLLFSRFEGTFQSLMRDLQENDVCVEELKGNSGHLENVLRRFRSGQTRVLFLHAHYMGSGVDLSMATDVILFHNMPQHEEQAIARAHRVGRTAPLRVHKLCYPEEI